MVRAAQEVKALNSRVLEFLSKPQSVLDLVRHLVSPPTPDADQGQALRLPFAACEVRARLVRAAPRGSSSDSCGWCGQSGCERRVRARPGRECR